MSDQQPGTSWSQLALYDATQVVITPKMVIDGPSGSICASVTVEEFWTGDALSVEVRPGLRFPEDLDLCLLWFEELVRLACRHVAPF